TRRVETDGTASYCLLQTISGGALADVMLSYVPIRLTQTPTIYSMRQPWRRNAVRRRIDKGSGQFLTVLKSGGGLKSLRKLNSEEGWVNGKHIQRGSC